LWTNDILLLEITLITNENTVTNCVDPTFTTRALLSKLMLWSKTCSIKTAWSGGKRSHEWWICWLSLSILLMRIHQCYYLKSRSGKWALVESLPWGL